MQSIHTKMDLGQFIIISSFLIKNTVKNQNRLK